MASVNINIFPSGCEVVNNLSISNLMGQSTLQIYGMYIPGSISFNTVFMLVTQSSAGNFRVGASFGLYSLNGSTLSLANSAALSTTTNNTMNHWISFGTTSATQNINPGIWFFGFVYTKTSGGNANFQMNVIASALKHAGNGGPFWRGWYSASTTVLPTAICTSDMSKEGSSVTDISQYPIIYLSA